MVLQNYIQMHEGKTFVVHLVDHEIVARALIDPVTRRAKSVNVLVFRADELDGQAVSTELSFTSEKAAMVFSPYLADKSYADRLWTITPRGTAHLREYEISSTPIRRSERGVG